MVRTNARRIADAPAEAIERMDWLADAFEPEFMQRALLAGLIAAAACAVVGTWIVLRGLTFLGDALAHGVHPRAWPSPCCGASTRSSARWCRPS